MMGRATTLAILGILVRASAAGLIGCGSDKVTIGPQDAAAGRDAPAGTSGGRATGGVTGAGGVAATGGIAGAGGTIGAGGVPGTGGASTTGKTCGGLAGLACAAAEICEIPPGHCCCDYSGTCAVRPQVCTTIYQPVCGCDGKTYGNDCERQVAGVSKNLDGACPATDAGAGGRTGTGGTTAGGGTKGSGGATGVGGSKGSGGATGVGGSSGGATGTGGAGGSTGKTCGGIAGLPCATGEFCEMPAATCNVSDGFGTCRVKTQGCPPVYQPVCGCDGKTYSTDCDRQAAGVSKNHDGACATTDAGIPDAPLGSCSQVPTQAECDLRSDCHSVFVDSMNCACAAAGCCAKFSTCADGGHANCSGTPMCTMVTPHCEAPNYVVSYTASCFEGCVHPSECASVDGGADASSAAALCIATGGQVNNALCCSSVADFPNDCQVGACGCAPTSSHTVSVCNCATGCFMPGYGCVGPAGTCTVGADQSCNDSPILSSVRGRCVADGRCVCAPGALLVSGKCQ